MKQRIFLSLATVLVGFGAAHAQSLPCVVGSIVFPAPSATVVKRPVPSGTCVETPGAQGRLRWDDSGSRRLELFDTDDNKLLLWCAHLDNGNSTCATGQSFCVQSDGNAVIYQNADCTGDVQWASNTVGQNINGEIMVVVDGNQGFPFAGEKAVIFNEVTLAPQIIWASPSFDPS